MGQFLWGFFFSFSRDQLPLEHRFHLEFFLGQLLPLDNPRYRLHLEFFFRQLLALNLLTGLWSVNLADHLCGYPVSLLFISISRLTDREFGLDGG